MTDLIEMRRSIRRFQQREISFSVLSDIVEAGRLAPSARNLQPLEFIIVHIRQTVAEIFPLTKWAGYLPEQEGKPPQGKEPVAYIVILVNRLIRAEGGGEDVGAAAENMILTALSKEIGTCWLGSADRVKLRSLLNIPDHFEIAAVLALGFADESPVAEEMTNSIKYYKDKQGRLHVPKRALSAVLHNNSFGNKDFKK